MSGRAVLLIGNRGGTNVGEGLERAARASGRAVDLFEAREAMSAPALVRRFNWWVRGRRPTWLRWFGEQALRRVRRLGPTTVIATGIAPLERRALEALGAAGARRLNFLTDDPWNPAHRAPWFLEALAGYDVVFTPRRANIDDLRRAGVPRVVYLPFAYDPGLHAPCEQDQVPNGPVVHVGGAEQQRLPFLLALRRAGLPLALFGERWERTPELARCARGQADPETVRAATCGASVNVVLVRAGNRDGHVMRSLEVPAMRACLVAQDTPEHRDLYGDTVPLFGSPEGLLQVVRALLSAPSRRGSIAEAAHDRIVSGGHSYVDRFRAMLALGE